MKMRVFLLVLLLAFNFLSFGIHEIQAEEIPQEIKPHSWSFVTIGLTPVQSGGRVKPLDSFAREVVLFETGTRSFEKWDPLDLILSWISFPKYWNSKPFIKVGREDVRRQLGLDEKKLYYSPDELYKNSNLIQYAERMGKGTQVSEPPGAPKANPREQELKAVLDRIGTFHGIVTGQGWTVVPHAHSSNWSNLAENDAQGEVIRNQFLEVLKSYEANDSSRFERASLLFKTAVEGEISDFKGGLQNVLQAESIYNRYRPFLVAWVLYLFSALIWVICEFVNQSKKGKNLRNLGIALTGAATLNHIFGFALRCFVAGRPPVTNMYESIIWVSLGVVVFAGILFAIHRQGVILAVACILATLGLIAGDAAPAILDPSLNPLVPVLRSNYWLTVHVLTITLGYAAFALTLGLANITLFQFLKGEKGAKISTLNQLTYRAMQFGVVLIAAGTILGGIWADYSWGRFWGWDPKEVWALITLLCYLVILHGRYASWVGPFGFAAWSAVSFLSVVMAWYGVNFILGVGLHSYGFSTGGTPWVLGFVAIQLAYVGAVTAFHFRGRFLNKYSVVHH